MGDISADILLEGAAFVVKGIAMSRCNEIQSQVLYHAGVYRDMDMAGKGE